ncbi:MAG: tyrosine--tRNA ligase [Fimbriimonadales bacterium]
MSIEEQMKVLSRGCAEIISESDLAAKLRKSQVTGKPLRVKLGVDPTVPHVTLGWAVVLRKLRAFQKFGHTACLIIGDFTATIGDPSGKSKTRPQLTRAQVNENVKAVEEQLYKILDKDHTEILYNADWLGKMAFADVIQLSSRITVARILERDDFQKRLADEKPIGMHEVLYPLCQGYDSVAMQADVELGGNDQKFNNLVGRNLQGQFGQEPQVVMLMPLLVGLDGKEKMSQSLGNYVSVVDTANDMFGKTMSIPDHLLESWFTLCTDVPLEKVRELLAPGANPRDAKVPLAREIVVLYHGEAAAAEAEDYFIRTFSNREEPVDAPEAAIPAELIKDGQVAVAVLIHALELTDSIGEARRLIKSGAISIGGDKIEDPFGSVEIAEVQGKVLKVGKHRFRTLR